jgi:hypothetical protein
MLQDPFKICGSFRQEVLFVLDQTQVKMGFQVIGVILQDIQETFLGLAIFPSVERGHSLQENLLGPVILGLEKTSAEDG